MPGWVVITGNNDGSANILLGGNAVPFVTKTFLMLDRYMQITLISFTGATTTKLYIDG